MAATPTTNAATNAPGPKDPMFFTFWGKRREIRKIPAIADVPATTRGISTFRVPGPALLCSAALPGAVVVFIISTGVLPETIKFPVSYRNLIGKTKDAGGDDENHNGS